MLAMHSINLGTNSKWDTLLVIEDKALNIDSFSCEVGQHPAR